MLSKIFCLFVSVYISHTGLLAIAAEISAEQYKLEFFKFKYIE